MLRVVVSLSRALALVVLTVPLCTVAAIAASAATATFQLAPETKFLNCFAASGKTPSAKVTVQQGSLNDKLSISLKNFKPGLAFDLFTVENSNLASDGSLDPDFVNFGLAWYQSDILVNKSGKAKVKIRTILVNDIFGFDPAASLPPTNTFHVGFWFDNPSDAQPCGFDPTHPTPFNGVHKAGPAAMISVPGAMTDLGPLCLSPNTSTTPPTCNP